MTDVWVKDQDGNYYYGNSEDLRRALSPMEDQRIFPCYDQHGESWALWPNQIKEYGGMKE